MSLETLDRLVSSLIPARDPVRLMGGEPTLHSRYPQIIRMLKAKNHEVVVFTNGLNKVLRETVPYVPDRILVNINNWKSYSKEQQIAIHENLAFFGGQASLGFTILTPQFDLTKHRDLILEHHLQPIIRLGLAQPIIGGDNAFLPGSALPEAHKQVADWAEALAKDGIRLSFDCGFMRSHFKDEDFEKLVRAHSMLRFDCTPNIDVGPGLRIWRCFAFSACEGQGWEDFDNLENVQSWFTRQDALLRRSFQDDDQKTSILTHDGCLARHWNRAENRCTLTEMNFINNKLSMETIYE